MGFNSFYFRCCIVLLLIGNVCFAQSDWKIKSNKSGLKVSTKTVSNSGLKGIRVQCNLPATLSQAVALILDVNAGKDWVYGTKSSYLLKRISPSELYYYSEVTIPWPLSNRDFVAHLTVTQNAKNKTVTIVGPTEPNYVPLKTDVVRVKHSYGKWVFSLAADNTIDVDYTLEVDPGGTIPVWLVNLFATSGPVETFKNMKQQIQLPKYVNAKLSFIEN